MQKKDLITKSWSDYALIDSGTNAKLERYGSIMLTRPETQAIWKERDTTLWESAQATFEWKEGKGSWKFKDTLPNEWTLSWKDIKFEVRPTSFKHTGIFPEQAVNWEWIQEKVSLIQNPKILNLFGYTGIASIVAAQRGASVTHIDASKTSLDWAHKNARLSGLPEGAIKYLLEDALRFVKREVRRNAQYDGIILDPPAFGRGSKGEVWKIEESLSELIASCKEILSHNPNSFFLLNGYAAGYSATAFAQLLESVFGPLEGEYGELLIQEDAGDRVVPSGIYVRFIRA